VEEDVDRKTHRRKSGKKQDGEDSNSEDTENDNAMQFAEQDELVSSGKLDVDVGVEELEHIEDEEEEIDEGEVEGIEQSAEDIREDRRTLDRPSTQQLIHMTERDQR